MARQGKAASGHRLGGWQILAPKMQSDRKLSRLALTVLYWSSLKSMAVFSKDCMGERPGGGWSMVSNRVGDSPDGVGRESLT